MLKVYAERRFLPEGVKHAPFLYPFWGEVAEMAGHPNQDCYAQYIERGHQFIELTSLNQADCVIFPAAWEHVRYDEPALEIAHDLARIAEESRKELLIFFCDDSIEKVPIDEAIVLRTSLDRSTRTMREFAMPAWSEDFVEQYLGGRLPIRQKRVRPLIGFCGVAMNDLRRLRKRVRVTLRQFAHIIGLRRARGSPSNPLGHVLRTQSIAALGKCPSVDTDFVVRTQFWGGAVSSGRQNVSRMQQLRAEYVNNIVNTDYTLCIRGSGNFSYRLYETLSCGRIPIFVNTDSVLPFDFLVDWKEYVVWVEQDELPRIGEIVGSFHDAISPEEFVERQRRCRELWETMLSPEGFFSEMWRHLPAVDPIKACPG